MVVPGGVEGEFSLEFTGGGVDDSDVEVLDEDQDAGSVVDAADADVVQAAVDAQGACDRRWLYWSVKASNSNRRLSVRRRGSEHWPRWRYTPRKPPHSLYAGFI